MRQIPALLAAACLLSHCAPPPDPDLPVFYPLSVTEDGKGAADQPPAQPPSVVAAVHQGIRLEGVGFDSRSHRLVVVDQPGGPGSEFADPQAAYTRELLDAIPLPDPAQPWV